MDYWHQLWDWAHQAWRWAVPNGLLDLLKALAAPIVAAAALRVSRQQVRINETKLRLDMYDRRVKVYGAVKDLLGAFLANGTLSTADLVTFREQIAEADFLFGEDVQDYLTEMDKQARRLIIEETKYRRRTQQKSEESERAYEAVDALHFWFLDQPEAAKAMFKRSLSMEQTAPRGWLMRFFRKPQPMRQ